jgi:uncharacterized protein YkwD
MDGVRLDQVKAGSEVTISVAVESKDVSNISFVAIAEVRTRDEVTAYLQYQTGVVSAGSSTDIEIPWKAETSGDYKVRTFLLSGLAHPDILSPVMRSTISVGFIDIEYTEPADKPNQGQDSVSTELKQYALKKINEDRKKFQLTAVDLSLNEAAQIHAEDVFKTKQISHWMTNGEKPYMTYSRYDGTGDVAQNVAASGDKEYHDGCSSGKYLCEKVDPFREIDVAEHGMMYEDEECCDNGHRDNILDKYHTHVSIGIAYDDYYFVLVQNFENQYITWTDEIDENNPDKSTITMAGYYNSNRDGVSSNDLQLTTINVYYDPLPTTRAYEENYDKAAYGVGDIVAVVVAPPSGGGYYEQPSDYTLIEANTWDISERDFAIEFSINTLSEKYGDDGVYTVVVWSQDESEDSFVASGISIFLKP